MKSLRALSLFLKRLTTVFVIMVIWEGVAQSGLISPLFLPGPLQVVGAFVDTFPTVLLNAAATLTRSLSGLMLGSLLGMTLGLSMTWSERSFRVINPIVENMRPIPAIAAVPFFILWFGTGSLGQILLTTFSCAVVLAVEVFHAVRNVSPIILCAARSLGASRVVLYQRVVIPAILPSITPGLRIVVALSFSIAVASEFMGAQWGLGYMIIRAQRTLETQTILMAMFLIGALARATDLIVHWTMSRLTLWAESSVESLHQFKEGFQP